MTDILQVALPKRPPVHSGRGVRFELLTPDERDRMLVSVATLCGTDDKKMGILRQREGVKCMLRQVTRERDLTEEQIFALPADAWIKVDQQMLADDAEYKKLFTAKDDELLCFLYRDHHEITKAEVDQIAGKVRTVSVD
jgi:hypothetical protein